jgi:hypothetical protein
MRNVTDCGCGEYLNTPYMFNNFFFPEKRADFELKWKNILEPGRPQITVWRMRIACWIPKARDTHSEYTVRLLTFRTGIIKSICVKEMTISPKT